MSGIFSAAPRRCAALASLCLLLAAPAWAAAAGKVDAQAILDRITQRQKAVQTLRADFVQTRLFADMDEEVEFRGTLVYRAPDRVRWHYLKPDESILILRADTASMIVPELQQVETYRVKENPKLEFFVSFFARGFEAFGQFNARIKHQFDDKRGTVYSMALTPRSGKNDLYDSIEFDVRSDDWTPNRIRVAERGGDTSLTRFENIRTGDPVDDKTFDVPPGMAAAPARAGA